MRSIIVSFPEDDENRPRDEEGIILRLSWHGTPVLQEQENLPAPFLYFFEEWADLVWIQNIGKGRFRIQVRLLLKTNT